MAAKFWSEESIKSVVRLMTDAEALDGQIQAIRRLVFEKADTILVAPTAYGKRTVLYAFYLLTAKIIIQIMPSMRAAKDQARAISGRITQSRPIVVTDDLVAMTDFFERMRAGQYTHILVSPELAASPKFIVELTRDPKFQNKLGLFAVQDLHMVNKWKEYSNNGVFLDGLRYALPNVTWYAYTAAFDHESQQIVPQIAGFDLQKTEFIRVPVNRPEISETFFPLESEDDFGHLNFLLAVSKPSEVRYIAKTVVYVADTAQLHKVCQSLWLHVQQLGFSSRQAKRIIQKFDTDDLRDEEKDILLRSLAGQTACRILVSTVSLSTGWYLPDIIRVVHWGFPMDGEEISIGEWSQRNGVAMRDMAKANALGYMSGNSYTFATYDNFDELERVMEKCLASSPAAQSKSNVNTRQSHPTTDELHQDVLLCGQATDSEESDYGSAASTSRDSSPSSRSTLSSLGDADDVHRGEPTPNTLAWFAWKNISDYCWQKASERDDLPWELTEDEFDDEGSHYYMDPCIQYAIGRAWSRAVLAEQDVPFTDDLDLFVKVPIIEDWEFKHSTSHVDELIEFCRRTSTMVYENWLAQRLLL